VGISYCDKKQNNSLGSIREGMNWGRWERGKWMGWDEVISPLTPPTGQGEASRAATVNPEHSRSQVCRAG